MDDRSHFNVETIHSTVRTSIGIALFPEHAASEVDLLQHTEVALLRATSTGSRYEFYEAVGTDSGRSRLVLIEELRLATMSEQLVCYFQPKVELATGRVVGAEALVRWEHPRLGLLGPDDFLPLAREAQLLGAVFQRVLRVAVEQSAEWMSRGVSLKIAVNLTVTDLLDIDLPRRVEQLLQLHSLAPSALVVEVTEEAFMAEPETVRNTLLSLHELGIGLSIDDFGSGYSSLAYLRSIPADELKLDRSFVTGIASDSFNRSVAIAVVGLAHSLGMRLVGEGVESEADAETLAALGCDLAQGYYLSQPLSAVAFEQWLLVNSPFTAILPFVSPSAGITGAGI